MILLGFAALGIAALANTALEGQLDAVSTISSAMERQLGLKLEASKIPVDTLVIDHVERTPIEN